jgi:hypothetical protein
VNAGPGGLVVEIIAAALVTAVGSLFAAGDAALSEIPEGRMQALSADATGAGAAYRRYTADPLRVLSRWLVGRVVALSAATVLIDSAARSAGLDGGAIPVAILGAVVTYGTFTEILGTLARRQAERACSCAPSSGCWRRSPTRWPSSGAPSAAGCPRGARRTRA